MKPHSGGVTPQDLLAAMMKPENLPQRTDVEFTPVDEAVAVGEKVREAVASGKVLVTCIGCGGHKPILSVALCDCGGFVCPACQRVETDGECEHEVSERPVEEET